MPIASNSSDQRRLSAEKGVKLPRINGTMNKQPALQLAPASDDRSDADTSRAEKDAIDDAKLIDTAKKRFKTVVSVESTNRNEGIEDLQFINGKQWSEADAAARAAEGRPCLTENRLPTFANQIINDQRQNRPAIKISPMGNKASKKDAKVLSGMIRAIERDSSADIAYDTGFQSAVHNGWGYWRVMTEYESETSFNKVIVVRPIPNPFNVYLDPARTPFMLDAKWGFVSEMLPRDEFEREYPDAQLTPWGEFGTGDVDKDWVNDKEVRVAEYYYIDYQERDLVHLDNGFIGWEDEMDESLVNDIASGRLEVIERRTVQSEKLKWAKLTALEVLERRDCDGHYVPIIECDGTVLNVNGKLTKKGIVRDAKSPQKMLNYYTTLEAEKVALEPKAPWIMEEGQIEGHEQKWQQANRKSFSYLLYKGVNLNGTPAPPPQRQPFNGPPESVLAAKSGNVEALRAITGIRFDATMSERMQDESGRAIRELNRNANLGGYHYIDNFGRALRNTGIVLVDLIPYVYDTKRIVSIVDESGAEDRIMIDPSMQRAHAEMDAITPDRPAGRGRVQIFNPKIGRYQVTVTIGPSYATKRVEAQEEIMDFMRVDPTVAPLIRDLVAKYSDWEGADQIAARLAKTLDPNLLSPDRDDMSPQTQALIAGMQKQIQQLNLQVLAANKALEDRQKDRDVIDRQTASTAATKDKQIEADHIAKMEKIEKDFEAKFLTVLAKFEDIQAKRESTIAGTIGRQLSELSKALASLEQKSRGDASQNLPAGTPGSSLIEGES